MPTETSVNNKRIAKNTIFLYVRMILIMIVSLYTSRVVLSVLGVKDFGIYNVVGGFLVLFSFLNSAMVGSTQRFLNFEMGRGNKEKMKEVFSMAINCHILILLIVIIVSETIGLWFLNNYLSIPVDRITAANWVFQIAVISSCISIFYAPYNAAIISYERMSIYAYVSIIEVILKLIMVLFLSIGTHDKLILYSFLYLCVTIIVCLTYVVYCFKNFNICHYHYIKNNELFMKMTSFSGWNLLGQAANLASSQGVNIILNMFFGVILNASMGIANQVQGAINQFSSNFSTAFNPQIVKSYASGEKNDFTVLIHRASRFSYFLVFIIALPVIICCNDILKIWLGQVPNYAVSFTRLILIYSLVDAINNPIWTAIRATGNIKKYNLTVSVLRITILPLCVVGYNIGSIPEFGLIACIIINIIIQSWTIIYLGYLIDFSAISHVKKAILPAILVTFFSIPIPYMIHELFSGYAWTFITIIVSCITTSTFTFIFGLEKKEKNSIKNLILLKLK